MAEKRLIGSDAKIEKITFATTVTGDGLQSLDQLAGGTSGDGTGAGYYTVEVIAATSAFDTDLAVGDVFYDDGTLVLDTGDQAKQHIGTEQTDVQSFSLEVSRPEINVTTLADDFMVYRQGKVDISGSFEGITTTDVTDSDGGFINNFFNIFTQSSAGLITKATTDDGDVFVKAYLDEDTGAGGTESFVYMRINILSTSLNGGGEDAQSYTANFRVAPGTPAPFIYRRQIAEA